MAMRKLRYIGDGAFVEGVPAADIEVDSHQAKELIASGAYEPYEETVAEKKDREAAEREEKASKASANAKAAADAAEAKRQADEEAKAADDAAKQKAANHAATVETAERTLKEAKHG